MWRAVKDQRGITRYEVVVCIIFISIIAYVALGYYRKLMIDAERAKVQYDVGAMHSAVWLRVADLIVSGEQERVDELVGSNPFDLLEQQPNNYLGVYPEDRSRELEVGHWFFAVDEGALVYIVRNANYCKTALTDPTRIKFKISSSSGPRGVGTRTLGIALGETAAYRWVSPWD
jgi:hypothetical protein